MQTYDTTQRKRILLVDDERLVRETVKELLPTGEYTVVEANNGAEALSLFARSRFDLVLTDFEMPFLKGDELATRIKRLAPTQRILMITAYMHPPGPDNPVDMVLRKPFTLVKLRSVVADLLQDGEGGTESSLAELHGFAAERERLLHSHN